jgi:primosomal protein N' (replication factor Y)
LGTERLEGELKELLGRVEMARLDRDTIRNRRDLDRELERFRSGSAQLLVGTQMVAKGHDFPGVTLVGVVAADASLNFPDFRAAERTFQLLTQVAGRAGRGRKPGRVLVQSYESDHYAIQCAMQHDYARFARAELAHRHELFYPPFAHLALVRCEGPDEAATRAESEQAASALRDAAAKEVEVLGPATAPLARLRGNWRMHVLLKSSRRAALRATLRALPPRVQHGRRIVDVDPHNML